ncbi:MAG TPA: transporter substrate-binding domain-containing protein [Rhizobium sp.]
MTSESKRNFLKGGLLAGGALATVAAATATPKQALAQAEANGGLDPNSALAKIRKTGKLTVGYTLNTLWFFRDLKSGQLTGVYKDILDDLGRDLEAEIVLKEYDTQTAITALRNGEFDLFGSTLAYTPARSQILAYVGPLWAKGNICITHKDFVDKFKSIADFNSPDVTFSQSAGQAEEARVRMLFPRAELTTTSGQVNLALEPIRAKRAHLFMGGEMDSRIFVKANSWAALVLPDQPFDRRANTFAVRYGDPSWESFMNFWCGAQKESGRMQQVYDFHVNKLLNG